MQKKNKFDKETLIKIGKSALLAGCGTAALVILNEIQAIEFSNPMLTYALAGLVPWLVNTVRQFMKGEVTTDTDGTEGEPNL